MSRTERDKGKRGEREVAQLLNAHGFHARRDGRLDTDLTHNIPGVHIEVKRRETLAIPTWWRQTKAATNPLTHEPVLVFRTSRTDWLAVVELDHLLELLAHRHGVW